MAVTKSAQRSIAGGRGDSGAATDAGVTTLTMTAAATAAPAGGTGATAGAYDTATNRDTAITCINTNRTRIAELVTDVAALDTRIDAIVVALQRVGLLV